MRQVRQSLAGIVFLAIAVGMTARGAEEKVSLDKVPKAALEAVKAKFKGAKLVGAVSEKDGDKVVYEITLTHRELKIEVSVTPDGKIVSIERTLAAKDLPRPVAEAVHSKYPKSKYERVEEVREGDKTTYEVLLVTVDKKKIEVILDGDGKIVKETPIKETDKNEK